MTLFDDDLMSRVFDNNIPATELVLRIILGRDIEVVSAKGRVIIKNPEVGGREIRLDVLAKDVDGEFINIEVQGDSEGDNVRRARYHSSAIDTRILKEGQKFKDLKDSYVVFIYAHDKFGKGLPIYHIERYVEEINEPFGDGSHIIYVNGKYTGEDPVGKLVEDFRNKSAESMNYKELADSVRHFKEIEKGRDDMCKAVEEYGDKRAKESAGLAKLQDVSNLMKSLKLTLDQALDALLITGDERTMIANQLK